MAQRGKDRALRPLPLIQGDEGSSTYRAKDGALVRELMHPVAHGIQSQSLVGVLVPSGKRTLRHRHKQAEKVYHITDGRGWMTIGEDRILIRQGDTIGVPAGTPHYVQADVVRSLHMLCCCVPAYCAEDVELLEADMATDVVSLNELAEFAREIEEQGADRPLPLLLIEDGLQAQALRHRLQLSQSTFWNQVWVSQSGSSRYESGRAIPDVVRILLHLSYGSDLEADELLAYLRAFPRRDGQGMLPQFGVSDGVLLRAFRERMGITQRTFWGHVFMTQSGGSRYEMGRKMPQWLPALLRLVYGSDDEAKETLGALRLNSRGCVTSPC